MNRRPHGIGKIAFAFAFACAWIVASASASLAETPTPVPAAPATAPAATQPTPRPASDAATPRVETTTLFIVQFTVGPQWAADKPPHEQAHFAEHSANLRRMRDAGMILVGGRYADKGAVIVRAADEAAVQRELDADPSVRGGIFRAEIFEFTPFYDGCIPKPVKKRD